MGCQKPVMELPVSVLEIETFLKSAGFDAEYLGPSDISISGFSDPGCYQVDTAIWLGDSRFLKLAPDKRSSVALLFAAKDFDALDDFPAKMVCLNPRDAFMALVEACNECVSAPYIHETAVISPLANLGSNVTVGAHAVIEEGVHVGDNTTIDAGSVIRKNTIVGSHCHVFPNCSIGSSGFGFRRLDEGGYKRLPHLARVVIGDDVEIGSCVVIDQGTFRDTIIGKGTKIDSHTLIGHNVQIGENCLIIGGSIHGNCIIGNNSEIIHAFVKNRVTIGDRVKVGIGSVVLKDVESDSECFGNPARVFARKE